MDSHDVSVVVREESGVTYFHTPGGQLLAITVKSSAEAEGIRFLTSPDDQFQIGLLGWPSGHEIAAHTHVTLEREISRTSEVLFIRSGKVLMHLYSDSGVNLAEEMLSPGDTAVFLAGGHGFVMVEPAQIIEIKQGPYLGEQEKIRFAPPTSASAS
jgi:mannose-6-phosphate isomerase-like protein (cupin superfamily)